MTSSNSRTARCGRLDSAPTPKDMAHQPETTCWRASRASLNLSATEGSGVAVMESSRPCDWLRRLTVSSPLYVWGGGGSHRVSRARNPSPLQTGASLHDASRPPPLMYQAVRRVDCPPHNPSTVLAFVVHRRRTRRPGATRTS